MDPSLCTGSFSATGRQRLTPCCAISFATHLALFGAILLWYPGQVRNRPPVQTITIDLNDIALPVQAPQPRPTPKASRTEPKPAPALVAQPAPPQPRTAVLPARESVRPKEALSPALPAPSPTPVAPLSLPARAAVTPLQPPAGAVRHAPAPPPVMGNPAGLSPAVSTRKAVSYADHEIRSGYLATLRQAIEKFKEYPLLARRKHLEGTAVVRFVVTRGGGLKDASLASSSGAGLLDDAALGAVRAVGAFPAMPVEIPGGEMAIEVPLTFRLAGR
jgi:periplasmic protein TonB